MKAIRLPFISVITILSFILCAHIAFALQDLILKEGYEDSLDNTVTLYEPRVERLDIALTSLPYFTDVTDSVNLSPYGSHSATFFDYDNDSDLDLYLVHRGFTHWKGHYKKYPNILLRNDGNYNWEDVTDISGLGSNEFSVGCLVNDIDNDGDDDVYLLNSSWSAMSGRISSPCTLYINTGYGIFTDTTADAGVGADLSLDNGFMFDYDNDGNLDIFLIGYDSVTESNAILYHNNGDGTFTDVSIQAGINPSAGDNYYVDGRGNPVFADFDNDNDMDVYIPNSSSTQQSEYYINDGDGTFSEVSALANLDEGRVNEACCGDYDNDGNIDIFVTGNFDLGGINHLYHNDGDGTFVDVAEEYGLRNIELRYEVAFVDFDNDGYLDILNLGRMARSPHLYKNMEGTGFVDVSDFTGVELRGTSCALLDYDNDGYLDLYSGGVEYTYLGDVYYSEGALFENTLSKNNWIRIELEGVKSNRDGIGARVIVVVGGLLQTRIMTGYKNSGFNSFASNIFGLGQNENIDYVKVQWPSGVIQTIDGALITGHYLRVREDSPPVLNPIGDKEVELGRYLHFFISATDSDGDEVRLGVTNLPGGARLYPISEYAYKWYKRYYPDLTYPCAIFYWRPKSGQTGEHKLTFWAEDLDEKTGEPKSRAEETITITVKKAPRRPPWIYYLRNYYNIFIYWRGYDIEDRFKIEYSYKIDSGEWSEWSRRDYLLLYYISRSLEKGWHTFQVKARDSEGLESYPRFTSFYVR